MCNQRLNACEQQNQRDAPGNVVNHLGDFAQIVGKSETRQTKDNEEIKQKRRRSPNAVDLIHEQGRRKVGNREHAREKCVTKEASLGVKADAPRALRNVDARMGKMSKMAAPESAAATRKWTIQDQELSSLPSSFPLSLPASLAPSLPPSRHPSLPLSNTSSLLPTPPPSCSPALIGQSVALVGHAQNVESNSQSKSTVKLKPASIDKCAPAIAARVYSKYSGKGNAFKARWGKITHLLHKVSDTVHVFPDPTNVGSDRIPKIAVSLKPNSKGNCAPVDGNFVAARAAKLAGKGAVEADQGGRHAGRGGGGLGKPPNSCEQFLQERMTAAAMVMTERTGGIQGMIQFVIEALEEVGDHMCIAKLASTVYTLIGGTSKGKRAFDLCFHRFLEQLDVVNLGGIAPNFYAELNCNVPALEYGTPQELGGREGLVHDPLRVAAGRARAGACGTNIHQDIKGTSISLPSPPTPPLSRIPFTFKSIATNNDNTASTALHIYTSLPLTSLPLASPPTPPTPPSPPFRCLISMLLGAPGALVIEAHAGLSEARHLPPPLLWNGALVWGKDGDVKGHVAGEYRAQDIHRAKVHAVHVTGDDMELMVLVENALARQTEWGIVAWDFSRPVAGAQRRGARGSGAGRVGHGGGRKKGGGDGAPTQHTGGVCEECKGAGGQRLVCALPSSLAGHRWWLDEGLVARELDITRALAQGAGHESRTAPADTNGGAAGKQPRDRGQGGGRGGAVEEEWAYEVKLAKDARVGACVVWPETKLHRHLLIGRPEPLLVFWRR